MFRFLSSPHFGSLRALCLLGTCAGLLGTLTACGGGGGGDGTDNGGSPPPPLTDRLNTGLATPPGFTPLALGRFLLTSVREADMAADRNGDGDRNDNVVALIDTASDAITPLALAVTGEIIKSDTLYAFAVPEAGQGAADLNGDGDTGDAVWFVFDPTMPVRLDNPLNTGAVTNPINPQAAGTTGGFVFLVSEPAAGRDLDGDGDAADSVVRLFDSVIRTLQAPIFGTHAPNTPLVAHGGRILVVLGEQPAQNDLNTDGDQLDNVLTAADFTGGAPSFVAIGGIAPRAVANHPFALTDNAVVYFIDENQSGGADLNGDGDAVDAIITVFDFNGFGDVFPQSPQIPSFRVPGDTGIAIATGGPDGEPRRFAVLGVAEGAQGNGTDLNNDLDVVDTVVAWIDTTQPGALQIGGVAMTRLPAAVTGDLALFGANEFSSGAIVGADLNGDTDTDDNVVFVLDMGTVPGTTHNTGFAAARWQVQGTDAVIGVSEAQQFGTDFNGNGQIFEIVDFYMDLTRTDLLPQSLGTVSTARTLFRVTADELRIAATLGEGQSFNFGDLNGDGDTNDTGIVLLGLDPTSQPAVPDPRTPFAAGTADFFVSNPIARAGDDVFAFVTSESMAGIDLNNDGDTNDVVLQYARYRQPDTP